ncbi:MAG: SUMF1/EgtB/PvdO family nonheme iron enzyme [Pirellulales bacterium]|nr:SUMF1/EgtB/PvdO family nonheme iron enzyme [Pirellulales bacterium]
MICRRHATMVLCVLCVWLARASTRPDVVQAEAPQDDAQQAIWLQTMLKCRAALAARSPREPVELGPWYTTGPLKAKAFDEAMFPEEGIDLQAKDSDGKPLWQQGPGWADGRSHDLPSSGASVATYLARTITTEQPLELAAGFGSDDGLTVWLNGKRLISNDTPRGVSPNSDRVVLPLQAGVNRLLVRIYNRGGGHGFFFSPNGAQEDRASAAWAQIEKDFPVHAAWMHRHLGGSRHLDWFDARDNAELEREMIDRALQDLGNDRRILQGEFEQLCRVQPAPGDPRWLALFERVCRFRHRVAELKQVNVRALRLAIGDLAESFPGRYRAEPFLQRLKQFEQRVGEIEMALAGGDKAVMGRLTATVEQFQALQRDALLANPLLDFDGLLLVRRGASRLGLPQNWQGNCALPKDGYDNEIAVLSPVRPDGKLTTLYRPEAGQFVGDVDLHFDGRKMLFSMPGSHRRWQIWEIGIDGNGLRQVTPGEHLDVDNYDACYLPDERIIFGSTRCFHGVPCVGGGNTVANLFIMDPDGSATRQLCFDQDHNWCPTVLNNGRVLYSRWEYSDSPHYFTRLLFHMNPDGTNQMEYYASNSMWPNSIFYARPIPDHPTKVVAVISGHHGVPRMGELVIFDPARGRHQAAGAVQRIPGHGVKVEPIIRDGLVNGSWPRFLHPYPLSENYYLVSCQPTADASWGIYLVDVFDNMVLLKEEPGCAMFEPVPLRKTLRPPAIPDRIVPDSREAIVYLSDVYQGGGLEGVPRGTVEKLRIYEPHFAYPQMGGHINIGIDGPWDVHRILGTVPVQKDGSAAFRVPANTPLAVQPLDADGKALQIMRSWFTAMPGEVLSCAGCHESQNSTPPSKSTLAARRPPVGITPWYGPVRGFSFRREVQPVLDEYCVGCHDGRRPELPDLRVDGNGRFRNFTPSYVALHPFVRRPGPESDYFMQRPLEYHAGVSELVQMLEKGHHNVQLDAEARDRLITWIDLNVPDHGTWHEQRAIANQYDKRRQEMRSLYAHVDVDPEEIVQIERPAVEFVEPAPLPPRDAQPPEVAGWPFDVVEAQHRQAAAGEPVELKMELADGVTLELVLIPPGEFVLGDVDGEIDEYPPARVRIERPFYLGKFEVTNAEYALFDPAHDSAYISVYNKDQSTRGEAADRPRQPVIRVTWQQAMAFCRWLSQTTGQRFTLPTEAQWEWACRAGTATPLCFGEPEADFSKHANLADQRINSLCRGDSPPWIPSVDQVNDGSIISDHVGKYAANAWGLCDMHGNVSEWTRTAYRPYPYDARDGRDDPQASGPRSVRGGSWYDRPKRARSAFRAHYEPWQRVFNVGFRVVMETP